jgi:hypothetical protein
MFTNYPWSLNLNISNFWKQAAPITLAVTPLSPQLSEGLTSRATTAMENTLPPEELLVHTLGLLESRLKRLEFLLNGGISEMGDTENEPNILSRIQKMEHALQQLSSKSDTVKILLNLRTSVLLGKLKTSTNNDRFTFPTAPRPGNTPALDK